MVTRSFAPNSDGVWFEHLSRAKAPSVRVFCFPYAGGAAEIYRGWQRWFPEQVDICLVHLPGRGKRISEQALNQLSSLVNEVADRMRLESDTPYALYGHSMGALVSFELSRELRRRHSAGPQHLFVSGHCAPQWPRNEPAICNLPDDQFVAELKRFNGTPGEVLDNREFIQLFIGALRADFQIVETYEYRSGEPLSCPITVYGGLQDEHVPKESCLAWQEQTSASCKVRMFKGDHFFIRDPGSEFRVAFRNDLLSAMPASWTDEI
jgi:surfactin synthase thioesterase subunit